MNNQKIIFISYSWDSPEHKAWVKKFCNDLQARLGEGFKVLLDQNQRRGTSLSRFMKHGLAEAVKVLIIGTPKYKEKSEASGGVAYETMVITNEMMSDMDTTKFYPILRYGTFHESFPTDIKDRIGDDFSDEVKYEVNLQIVVDALIEELSPQDKQVSDTKDQTIDQPVSTSKLGRPNRNDEQEDDNLVFTVGSVSFKMILVEGGTFMMGASEEDSDSFIPERPSHQVRLSSYYIGETEVTQSLWEIVMNNNPSRFKGKQRPVEKVSWYDCQEFIEKLNAKTGRKFRLPTEAEWEFAARGGNKSKGYKYSESDTLDDVAWYCANSVGQTHDVAGKNANELGIFDMSGNVWEWCSDWYGKYSLSAQMNPLGPDDGKERVPRGGSWNYGARFCRISDRAYGAPHVKYNTLGIRLVLSK